MKNFIAPSSIYTFLKYCNASNLNKEILDCGAGGFAPPLSVFYDYGYTTYGIEISDEQLEKAKLFCEENEIDLNIIKGDMRKLPYDNEKFSFVYSYNTTVHMPKKDFKATIKEMERVLKKDGYCFVNFLSNEGSTYGSGQEVSKGEFLQDDGEEKVLFCHYEDSEAENHFINFHILHKERRMVERYINGEKYISVFIDYILKKK